MRLRRTSQLVALAMTLAGCGDSSTSSSDGGNTGAATGTGGGATTGSTTSVASSSGTGGGSGCPTVAPVDGAACSEEALGCTYNPMCCAKTAVCTGGVWVVTGGQCPAPVCPTTAPVAGSSCACMKDLSCDYGGCNPATSPEKTVATCDGATWTVGPQQCETVCGTTLICSGFEICERDINGAESDYKCIQNPCLPNLPACGQCPAGGPPGVCPQADSCGGGLYNFTCHFN